MRIINWLGNYVEMIDNRPANILAIKCGPASELRRARMYT